MTVTHGFNFGLYDAKIAERVSEGAWGTNYDIEAVQMMGVEVELETGELPGDDVIVDQHSKIQAVNGNIRFGFKDLQVLAVLTGITLQEYDNYERIIFSRNDMKYFGITGRANSTETSGDKQLFIPKAKLMGNFSIGFEKGQYVVPDIAFRGVWENETYGAAQVIANNTAQTVTVPPTMQGA